MLEWTASLATGNADVDRQHQEIFAKLNGIEEVIQQGADKECLIRLITALLDYTYIHFHHEESAMSCTRCPFHDSNCDAHRGFIERLRHWLAVVMEGRATPAMLQEVHTESCAWILHHIAKVDIGLLQSSARPHDPVLAG
jgi:hemerythrin